MNGNEMAELMVEPGFASSVQRIGPDYCEAFGNLARLVTGAISSTDPKKREEYLQKCQGVIDQVYDPAWQIRFDGQGDPQHVAG